MCLSKCYICHSWKVKKWRVSLSFEKAYNSFWHLLQCCWYRSNVNAKQDHWSKNTKPYKRLQEVHWSQLWHINTMYQITLCPHGKKNKDKTIQSYRECGNVKHWRVQYSPNENLDKAVCKWLLAVRNKNAVVNTLILKEKSSIFAKVFGITDFVPSDGWITHWKRWFNISFKKISGEGASCTPEMVSPWKETSLPRLLSNYDLKDITPTNLMVNKEQCIGGKQSMVRITGMAASNA